VAVCSSCHGAHDILPPDDPKSRVAKGNLKETCGKCHPGANDNFVQYIAHVDYTSRESHPAVFYTFWGMTILLCSVLAVFIPHSLLWFQRTLIGRLKHTQHGGEKPRMVRRFNTVHRITHGLIIISFMGLVATGFPLKYSYAGWAHNLTAAFGGIYAMGILHRVFAIITFAYAGAHFAYLVYFFWRKCPKPRWRYVIGPDSMLFSFRDFKDFIAMVRWFFRIGPRPRFDRWTYFEKFDYWGEIWGVFLIGGTGLMLWMPTLFTRWLPGWVLNCAMVVHSIEALLAASVIFLVHFFNTHLRPEKFPIDMTMWTGQISEEEMKEERPAEYERLVAANELESRIEDPISLRWRIVGVVLGISAFLFGISLIILAIRTELFNITG
jgi:cytochrome b subunit of formate dehydrogenase